MTHVNTAVSRLVRLCGACSAALTTLPRVLRGRRQAPLLHRGPKLPGNCRTGFQLGCGGVGDGPSTTHRLSARLRQGGNELQQDMTSSRKVIVLRFATVLVIRDPRSGSCCYA